MPGAKRGRWEAIFTLSANKTITFTDTSGATVVTLTAGDYTITSMMASIDSQLDADWSTLTFSSGEGGTGKITINSGLVPFSVAWTDTTTRDLMGFTADITNVSASQTGTRQAKTVWMPGTEKWTAHGDDDGNGSAAVIVAPKTQTINQAGTVKTIIGASTMKEFRGLRYEGVLRARAKLIGEDSSQQSFERFWNDTQNGAHSYCSTGGCTIRLYWDADVATYTAVRVVGMHEFDPVKPNPNWVGRYNIEFPRLVIQP